METRSVFILAFLSLAVGLLVGCGPNEEDPAPVASTVIDETGGTAESDDGHVLLGFPPDAVEGEAEVTIQKQPDPDRDDFVTNLYDFEVDRELQQPVQVEIELVDEPGDADVVLARHTDAEPEAISGSGLDEEGEKVVGQLSEFSEYGGWAREGSGSGSDLDTDNFEIDLVQDIDPDGSSSPRAFAVAGGDLFFRVEIGDGLDGVTQIWTTDGTEQGTGPVTAFEETSGSVEEMTAYDSELYFRFEQDASGDHNDLWATDASRTEAREIYSDQEVDPRGLAVLDGQLYFRANHGDHEGELLVTDGTVEGTDPVAWAAGLETGQMLAIGDQIFFGADDGEHGTELWVTDGTESGTRMVRDINPDGGSSPGQFVEYDGQLVFRANAEGARHEPWISDGTEEGTQMIEDLLEYDSSGDPPGINGSYPRAWIEYDGRLLFEASSAGVTSDPELWATDGTSEGTEIVHDVRAYFTRGRVIHDGQLYFVGSGEEYSRNVWVTDGTEGGTQRVTTLEDVEGDIGSGTSLNHLTLFDGYLFFTAEIGDDNRHLWVTDGNATARLALDGAVETNPVDRTDFAMTVHDGALYFSAEHADHGRELWRLTIAE